MIGENPSFKFQDIAQREFAKENGGIRITMYRLLVLLQAYFE